jgi:hypothetical protein
MPSHPSPRRYPVVLGLTLLATLGLTPAAPSPAQARTVYGRVTDAETGAPLETVSVVAVGTRTGAISTSNGTFVIRDVIAGATTVLVRHPCYLTVQVTIGSTDDVQLSLGLPFDESSLRRAGCGGLGARRPPAR